MNSRRVALALEKIAQRIERERARLERSVETAAASGTTAEKVAEALAEAIRRDDAFEAELVAQYGERANVARYEMKARETWSKEVAAAYEAKIQADARVAFFQGVARSEAKGRA